MFSCCLCEKEVVYTTKLCEKCRRIKHLLNLYEDRVYEVLESVLVRKKDQQENKIRVEITKEKKSLEENIKTRSNLIKFTQD